MLLLEDACRLKDVQRAQHIHARTEEGIGAAGWDLQAR